MKKVFMALLIVGALILGTGSITVACEDFSDSTLPDSLGYPEGTSDVDPGGGPGGGDGGAPGWTALDK